MKSQSPKLEPTVNYLDTLEKVKEQYQRYVEISALYSLPTQADSEPQYASPSLDHPLTSNSAINAKSA